MHKYQIAFNFLVAMALSVVLLGVRGVQKDVPEAVAKLVDDDMVLSAMRNAKFDCEKVIPRTQECILVYDFVAVGK